MCMAIDCLGVTHTLEKQAKVIIMPTKLHHIDREFFLCKSKRLMSLTFVKVEAQQDDIKSFEQL